MGLLSNLFGGKKNKAEAELRDTIQNLKNIRDSNGAGKSQSEKVALAHIFSRDATAAVIAVAQKYSLTDNQAERLVDKVLKG